ncbi:hypothetical protein KCU77_g338, partial [Aureobasidium melanogenum]
MDLLRARDDTLAPFIEFFIDHVECPAISPFDPVNWSLMKHRVSELSHIHREIRLALVALSSLCKTIYYSLPDHKALNAYCAAKDAASTYLASVTNQPSIVLVVLFLLSHFELLYSGDCVPFMENQETIITSETKKWISDQTQHSELDSRILVWMKIIFCISLRGGGNSVFSNEIHQLIPYHAVPATNIQTSELRTTDLETQLYQLLSAPVFDFYFRLQSISGEIAMMTHYHRSRTTGPDQVEISQQIISVKEQLHTLWENRSAVQRQTPEKIRSLFSPEVSTLLIAMIGICHAAYHTEFVELDRVRGDPVAKWTDSDVAVNAIRDIVDGDWETQDRHNDGSLNPAYLRPLFLCAIECMDSETSRWAVEKLRRIKHPVFRGEFFASFAEALAAAQRSKDRRVTSRYFCLWFFGVPPPSM